MSKKVSTTPPKLISKDAAARELRCDRRTLSKIIDAYEIDPAGTSAAAQPLFDLEDLREALMDHRAAQLPPMTREEETASLIALLEFHALMLDALAPVLPSETVRTAFEEAQEMRRAGMSPQFLWAKGG